MIIGSWKEVKSCRHSKLKFLFIFYLLDGILRLLAVETIVFNTGPDRPVRPGTLGTVQKSDLVWGTWSNAPSFQLLNQPGSMLGWFKTFNKNVHKGEGG